LIGLAQADDAHSSFAQREGEHEEASTDQPGGNQPSLSVALAAVNPDLGSFPLKVFSSAEPDPVLCHVGGLLGRVEIVAQDFIVGTNNGSVNRQT
jgi:hypothetical protein